MIRTRQPPPTRKRPRTPSRRAYYRGNDPEEAESDLGLFFCADLREPRPSFGKKRQTCCGRGCKRQAAAQRRKRVAVVASPRCALRRIIQPRSGDSIRSRSTTLAPLRGWRAKSGRFPWTCAYGYMPRPHRGQMNGGVGRPRINRLVAVYRPPGLGASASALGSDSVAAFHCSPSYSNVSVTTSTASTGSAIVFFTLPHPVPQLVRSDSVRGRCHLRRLLLGHQNR